MITLRAKPDAAGLAKAIKAAVGTEVPAVRRIVAEGDRSCGWMSPDEYLLVLPYAAVAGALEAIGKAMAGAHHLAVDVSDARAVFRVEGALADQVLAKLSPVDFATLEPGELRRTRAAQVAAALWREGDGFTVVCFRSVGRYVFDLLASGAKPGSELG
jgi:sarcosine oxidase subunit gamma